MSTETEIQHKTLTVNFGGKEYEVEVSVTLAISHWEENHGPGLREPMSDFEIEDVEIIGGDDDLPKGDAFMKAIDEELEKVDDWS